MQVVQTSVGTNGLVGGTITDQHTGVNMLFHVDQLNQDSDLVGVLETLGTKTVRYPGGTIAEEYLDITNPDQSRATNIIDVMGGDTTPRERDVVPISEYLNFKASVGGDAIICMPTYRFFDTATGQIRPDAEAEIKTFVRDLLIDAYGPTGNVVLELGNEFYQHKFDWTVAEFGAVQAQISDWIDEEATSLGLRGEVTILPQAGRSLAENQLLASFFDDADGPSADGVLTHLYGTNSNGNPLAIGGGIDNRLEDINEAWSAVLGKNFDLAVTEWNVGESGEETTLINGLMRSAPLMRMYTEMIANGVDIATIWSAQTNGPAGLSQREGYGSDLSPTGYFFNMLSNATEGLRLVDPKRNFKMENAEGTDLGYHYTFESVERSVSYFVSGVNEAIDLSADMTRYYQEGAWVYATVLQAAPSTTGTEYWAEASIRHESKVWMKGDATDWRFDFELQPYEMVELHIVYDTGISLKGDSQNAIADNMRGTEFGDTFYGELGNDRIDGKSGDDVLGGGAGDDVILGQWGNDELIGGSGNDGLYGGRGNDFLRGGSGGDTMRGNLNNDEMHGGSGSDIMYGGGGNDILRGDLDRDFLLGENGKDILDGGAGNDNLTGGLLSDTFVFKNASYGYDRVKDFEVGEDKVDLTDFHFATFNEVLTRAEDKSSGVKIDFGEGNVLFMDGLTTADLQASDFML